MKFLRRFSLLLSLFLAVCFCLPAAHAQESSPAGLYLLTPHVPRGAKVYAVDRTQSYNLSTSLDGFLLAEEPASSLSTQDGDLDGYRLIDTSEHLVNGTLEDYPIAYGTGAQAQISMPFSYYDAKGKPSGQFYYAENYSGGALSGLAVLRVSSDSCFGGDASQLSVSASALNALAFDPAASKENPFVLYALDCGAAAVTLDGSSVSILDVKESYTAPEVRLAALALHKKRKANVLPGEEVVCATSVLPKEQLSPQYGWTFRSLTKAGSLGFNKLLAERGYPFHDFTFQKVREPACSPALYTGTQEVTTAFGTFRLEAYVLGERIDLFAILPSGKNCNVYPGESKASVLSWAEQELWEEQLTARMREALGDSSPNLSCPSVRPYGETAALFLGEKGSAFQTEDGWYLCHSLWMQRPRDYYGDWNGEILLFACANAPAGSDPAKAEVSVLASFRPGETYSDLIVLPLEPGESLTHLIGRLREQLPRRESPFSPAQN